MNAGASATSNDSEETKNENANPEDYFCSSPPNGAPFSSTVSPVLAAQG
jgi:hypothetical protein